MYVLKNTQYNKYVRLTPYASFAENLDRATKFETIGELLQAVGNEPNHLTPWSSHFSIEEVLLSEWQVKREVK